MYKYLYAIFYYNIISIFNMFKQLNSILTENQTVGKTQLEKEQKQYYMFNLTIQ